MADPILHVLAGPNGAGKSTFYEEVLAPLALPFVNADSIADEHWPGDEAAHAYEAADMAAQVRQDLFHRGASFVTETVFSHPSKVDLITQAVSLGYEVVLHVILVPEHLTVARVGERVRQGGHSVPEDKIRSRYQRLWRYIATAIDFVDTTYVYDNTVRAHAFRHVATYQRGTLLGTPAWPNWTPEALRLAGA